MNTFWLLLGNGPFFGCWWVLVGAAKHDFRCQDYSVAMNDNETMWFAEI